MAQSTPGQKSSDDQPRVDVNLADVRGFSAFAAYALDVPPEAFTVRAPLAGNRTEASAWSLDLGAAGDGRPNGTVVANPPWDPPADALTLAFSIKASAANGAILRLEANTQAPLAAQSPKDPVLEVHLRENRFVVAVATVQESTGVTVASAESVGRHLAGRWYRLVLRLTPEAAELVVDGEVACTLDYEQTDLPAVMEFPDGPTVVFGGTTSRTGVSTGVLSYRARDVWMWNSRLADAAVARDLQLRTARTAAGDRAVRVNWGTDQAIRAEWAPHVAPALYLVEEYRMSLVAGEVGMGQLIVFDDEEDGSVSARPASSLADPIVDAFAARPDTGDARPDPRPSGLELVEGFAPSTPANWARVAVEGGVAQFHIKRQELVDTVLADLQRQIRRTNAALPLDTERIRRPARKRGGGAPVAVIRQVNQRYAVFVHLVDVRIGYGESLAGAVEVGLEELEDLLKDVIVSNIVGEADYRDIISSYVTEAYRDLPEAGPTLGVVGITCDEGPLVQRRDGALRVNRGRTEVVRLDTGASALLPGSVLRSASVVLATPEVIETKIETKTPVSTHTGASLEVEELAALQIQNDLMRARLDLVSSGELPLERVVELLQDTAPQTQPDPLEDD